MRKVERKREFRQNIILVRDLQQNLSSSESISESKERKVYLFVHFIVLFSEVKTDGR